MLSIIIPQEPFSIVAFPNMRKGQVGEGKSRILTPSTAMLVTALSIAHGKPLHGLSKTSIQQTSQLQSPPPYRR